VFTARYALSPYIKQIRFVFRGLRADEVQGMSRTCRPGISSPCLQSECVNVRTHRTVILPVLLYGCELWSSKLREELNADSVREGGV
jgi:hypothetical protein